MAKGEKRKEGKDIMDNSKSNQNPEDVNTSGSEQGSKASTAESQPGSSSSPRGSSANEPSRQRYLISHLLSVYPAGQGRIDAASIFNNRLEKVLLPTVSVASDSAKSAGDPETLRRIVICEANPAELRAKAAEMTPDTIIEPELLRVPARAYPIELQWAAGGGGGGSAGGAGTGTTLTLNLTGPNGESVKGAAAYVAFAGLQNPAASTVVGGISRDDGTLTVPYDPNQWRPTLVAIEPSTGLWTIITRSPQSGQTLQLTALPTTGPIGWWHSLSGSSGYRTDAGKGIKVGIVDSGVGPHPYLDHVIPIGNFIDGSFSPGASQGRDVQNHGTHVSGIIGARPPQDSGAFAGIAPGADVYMARIFTATGGGNQGDVANAVAALTNQYSADIINMSLTGSPSAIEHDQILIAYQKGTVCVCAAGNQNGSPVGYPAAYPECIAVSALGLINTAPSNSMPALNSPSQGDRFGYGGIFLASFSNIGLQVLCAAPGNGIISTIPARDGVPAPYADMSGTSMASPLVAGILANLLAQDPVYIGLQRNAARSNYAKAILARHSISIGLNQLYQGAGLARFL